MRARVNNFSLATTLVATLLLGACGGGGGDSFVLGASGQDNTSNLPTPVATPAVLRGTVAVGAPLVAASVSARCNNQAVPGTVLTDANGAYNLPLGTARPPCLLQATGGSVHGVAAGLTLHGYASETGLAQINTLTELLLSRAMAAEPATRFGTFGATPIPAGDISAARTYLVAQLASIGLAAPVGDLLNGSFSIGDDNDQLMDELQEQLTLHYAALTTLRDAAVSAASISQTLAATKFAAEEAARIAAEEAAQANAAISGVAIAGGPVSGATVALRCASGTPQSGQTTNAQGAFSVRLQGATLPCMLELDGGQIGGKPNTMRLHGLATQVGAIGVNPLAEVLLAHAWANDPGAVFASFSATSQVPTAQDLNASRMWLDLQLTGLGLAATPSHPATSSATAGDASDALAGALLQTLDDKGHSMASALALAARRLALASQVLADRPIALRFDGVAGNTPVACGDSLISGLGSGSVNGKLTDFRFYLSEAFLVRSDGVEVPLKPPANDAWTYTDASGNSVTLIDLEDATGACADEGTPETNPWLRGSVPAGKYVGMRVTMGVPYALNHSNPTVAAAPLDNVAMSWSWLTGRKYAKIEIGQPALQAWKSPVFYVHLGATNCSGNPALGTVVCNKPNRSLLRFDSLNPDTQRVLVDVRALLSGTDITINQRGAGGCMSDATDLDCLHVFEAMGIDWRTDGTGTGLPVSDGRSQTLFRVENK